MTGGRRSTVALKICVVIEVVIIRTDDASADRPLSSSTTVASIVRSSCEPGNLAPGVGRKLVACRESQVCTPTVMRPDASQGVPPTVPSCRISPDPPTCAASTRSSWPSSRLEIRDTIIETVAVTGGHLGSSLGVVELTIALHRLLESPRDRIVWDTGHQAYPHKLLTGRLERFGTLRQLDGIGGFPRRSRVGRTTSSTAATPAPGSRSPRGSPRRATSATGSSGSRSSSVTPR